MGKLACSMEKARKTIMEKDRTRRTPEGRRSSMVDRLSLLGVLRWPNGWRSSSGRLSGSRKIVPRMERREKMAAAKKGVC